MAIENLKRKLFDVYCTLAQDCPQELIRPSKVIEAAGIARSTFYRYYSSLDSLLEDMEQSILQPTARLFASNSRIFTEREDLLIELLKFYRERSKLVGVVRYSPRKTFLKNLYRVIQENFLRICHLHNIPLDPITQYVMTSILLTLLIPSSIQPTGMPEELVRDLNHVMHRLLSNPMFSGSVVRQPLFGKASMVLYDEQNRSVPSRLKRAYVALASNSQQALIRVQQLAAEAEVSRSTFYFHYGNLNELRLDLENDLIQPLSQMMERSILETEERYQYLCRMFSFCEQNWDAILAVRYMPDSQFLPRLRQITTELYEKKIKRQNLHLSDFSVFCAKSALLNCLLPTETKPDFPLEEFVNGVLHFLIQLEESE